MPVLIDSDILIEVSRARDQAVLERWDALSASDAVLLCSLVSVAELWHEAKPREHAVIERVLGALECVPIDYEIGRAAGGYLAVYAKSCGIEIGDALIAATAAVHDAELWTRNRKHYPMRDIRFF